MFWALEQRQKRQKAFRDEIVAQAERDVIVKLMPLAKERGISEDELRQAIAKDLPKEQDK